MWSLIGVVAAVIAIEAGLWVLSTLVLIAACEALRDDT